MTTIAKLLAQKQRLLERLQEDPSPHVREEIERLLAEIDAELNQLDEMANRDGYRRSDYHRCLQATVSVPLPWLCLTRDWRLAVGSGLVPSIPAFRLVRHYSQHAQSSTVPS